jgi:hypothetical protein
MTHRQLAHFACRLLALYLLAQSLPAIPTFFMPAIIKPPLSNLGGSALACLLTIWAIVFVLWCYADLIAERMIPLDNHDHPILNKTNPTHASIALPCITVLGLYMLCRGMILLPPAAISLLQLQRLSQSQLAGMEKSIFLASFAPIILNLVIGYFLTFRTQTVYDFIQSKQFKPTPQD